MSKGVKELIGKTRWSLVPFNEMEQVAKVLNYGAVTKYAPNNWKNVEQKGAYLDAIIRHWSKYINGEENDVDSKESHLASIICNCLFLMEDRNSKKEISFKEYLKKLTTYDDYVTDLDVHKFDTKDEHVQESENTVHVERYNYIEPYHK